MNKIDFIILGILGVFFFNCKSQQPTKKQTQVAEGLSGIVLWREGNFMPSMDGSNKNKSIGIARDVLIYELTKVEQARREGDFYTQVNTKLVRIVTSDEKGAFKVQLNPGTYSIFTKEEGGLFANMFDGQNNIFPVTVDSGKVTQVTVIVDYKAAY